ncbi:hypothetical protein [Algoriphagus hitonicola]|nr:hypothetical protein [Algoriphagus hitonicola]
MKNALTLFFLFFAVQSSAQIKGSQDFWETLAKHCGNAYEGQLVNPESDPRFEGRLIMHVRSCEEDAIRIPFFVGEDRSRTWMLTKEDDRIKLKHDHCHEDGSEDEITQYGGISSNTGFSAMQLFPADQETTDLIPYAAGNVWWITVDEEAFTYNLRRIGSETYFSVKFDLTKPVETPPAPWGWDNQTKK